MGGDQRAYDAGLWSVEDGVHPDEGVRRVREGQITFIEEVNNKSIFFTLKPSSVQLASNLSSQTASRCARDVTYICVCKRARFKFTCPCKRTRNVGITKEWSISSRAKILQPLISTGQIRYLNKELKKMLLKAHPKWLCCLISLLERRIHKLPERTWTL